MDSPDCTKITTTTTTATTITNNITFSNSPPVQESPFSNYVSNLSPIQPAKAPRISQGSLGLNSPPLVFTSPRISVLPETGFLSRSQNTQSSSAEISQHDGESNKFSDGPVDMDKSVIQLGNGLNIDAQDTGGNNNVQVQPSSSSGCVYEYLAEPVEGDSANSECLIDPNVKQSNDKLQLSLNGVNDATESQKGQSEFDDKNDTDSEVDAPLTLSKVNLKENLRCDVEQIKTEEEQRVDEQQSNSCPNVGSHLSVDHAYEKLQCKCLSVQNARGSCGDECKCSTELPPEHMQIAEAHEDCGENEEAVSNGPVDNIVHDSEASQHQRGMSRRCLQFEARPKAIVHSSSNLENNVTISRSPGAAAESETFDSSRGDSNATSSSRQLVHMSQPMATVFRPCNSGKSSIPVSKPSGIGLHLNSIINPVPMGHGAMASMKLEDGYTSVQGMKSATLVSHQSLENIKNGSKLSNLVGKASAVAEDRVLEMKASVAASSVIPEFHTMEPLRLMQPTEHHATPRNKRKFISEHADSFEEVNQQSSKKKKKKSSTTDDDGCKRCNCKKTKCLKLYCDCFAAGIYCADPCACQGCFNRPEYEDTVLETRQQIESRNPLAFAPKIVKRIPEFPENNGEDGNLLTPSSARHKRGCNCKKSMCQKKYCECYQANVGCSIGCRCEGCKNVYGRKDEYVVTEELVSNRASNERSKGMFDDKMEMVVANKDFLHAELYDLDKLTPLTPSFQCSDRGKDAPKSRPLCRRYLPSPDSDDLTMLSSYTNSPRSPRNSDSNDMILETGKEISEIGSYGQGIDYDNADMVEYFSSKCDSLADVCHLTPLPNLPSMSIASSASSKPREWTNGSRLQLCSGSGRLSSGSSLRWRSSPITPMIQSGGNKSPQGLDSNNGLYGILEDDTPEILKDASTPIKSLKVSSPKRKRVSPPHGHMHELGSSSSGALKSGRKFILKAVPSFPPLTPCIKSKGITNQTRSDSEQNSSKE